VPPIVDTEPHGSGSGVAHRRKGDGMLPSSDHEATTLARLFSLRVRQQRGAEILRQDHRRVL
jgi:hypothetical protein